MWSHPTILPHTLFNSELAARLVEAFTRLSVTQESIGVDVAMEVLESGWPGHKPSAAAGNNSSEAFCCRLYKVEFRQSHTYLLHWEILAGILTVLNECGMCVLLGTNLVTYMTAVL